MLPCITTYWKMFLSSQITSGQLIQRHRSCRAAAAAVNLHLDMMFVKLCTIRPYVFQHELLIPVLNKRTHLGVDLELICICWYQKFTFINLHYLVFHFTVLLHDHRWFDIEHREESMLLSMSWCSKAQVNHGVILLHTWNMHIFICCMLSNNKICYT